MVQKEAPLLMGIKMKYCMVQWLRTQTLVDFCFQGLKCEALLCFKEQ